MIRDHLTLTHEELIICAALEANMAQPEKDVPPSKYHVKNIWKDEEWLDFYMIYDMQKVGKPHQIGDSAIEHAMKKLPAPGMRHTKTRIQDIKEAIWSLQNAVKMIEAQEQANG